MSSTSRLSAIPKRDTQANGRRFTSIARYGNEINTNIIETKISEIRTSYFNNVSILKRMMVYSTYIDESGYVFIRLS